ncbi:sulfurtransferase [Caldibacillus lycopersici]|uniref:Sulfurtransferase n=1 Tax=Perspicuibacillus lycopersici TaxID=1325689 RepID=A0AAE3IUH9_9BACI|nr:sulfurtransferase [Perspicuibacillus lycopersici]MCU9613656.1 sulfurtransferase [Perspicuibacillus lycopersici]
MQTLLEATDVWKILHGEKQVRFVDCRFSLADPMWGSRQYQEKHIENAVYFDLEKDLSGPVGKHGGRHPLPDVHKFQKKLAANGISNQTIIIAYDQGASPFAARFWWLMKYIGHQEVYVINGGFSSCIAANFPVTNVVPSFPTANYVLHLQSDLIADVEYVKQMIASEKEAIIIDSRERSRYLGETEPIDKKAGHIPGAINKVWTDGVKNGSFLADELQVNRFQEISKEKEIIVYCGSGVTAAPNVLLLKNIGYENVKLYVGSFSDWISYEENPIAIGDNN